MTNTIKDMQNLAEIRGGNCLSKVYLGCKEKHLWECSEKHQWQAIPDNISQGKWCLICSIKIRSAKRQQYFIHDAQLLASSRSGKCLSKTTKNTNTKLLWECSSRHVWEALFSSVLQNHWCPYCSKYTTERKCRYIIEQLTGYLFPKTRSVLGKYELDGYSQLPQD